MYKCEVPGCERDVVMRSRIKTGDNKGLKACSGCKYIADNVNKPRKKLKPFTEKTQLRRKEERSGLPKFFEDAIADMQENPTCVNCGCTIDVDYKPHWNIAHILCKSIYKSVMDHPLNYIILCSSKDSFGNSCHEKFDNNISEIHTMPCFEPAKKLFEKFKHEVVEGGRIFRIFEENN